jgi:hypothetical protein
MGGGGDSYSSPLTSVSHSDLERLPEDEIEELREQLQTSLDEHESVPGVTSLGTSETELPQRLVAQEEREELAEAVRDAAAGSEMPSGGIGGGGGGGGSAGGGPSPGGGGGDSVTDDPFSADLSAMLEELEEDMGRSPIDDLMPDSDANEGSGDGEAGFDPSPVDTDGLDIDPPDLSDVDSRDELARSLFTDSASVNPNLRYGDGDFPSEIVVGEGEDQRVGNLHSFEMPESDADRTDLARTGNDMGRTAEQMERVAAWELDGDYGTERAFVTHYDDLRPDDDTHRPPQQRHAGREVAVSVFGSELGANVPRHAYVPEQNLVASEEFPGDSARNAPTSAIEQVSADNLTDTLAVQVLAGNTDTHAGNIFVNDAGETACIDLDIAGKDFSDIDAMERELDMRGANRINRKGGPNIEKADVMERAQEIAISLHNDGRLEKVTEKTRQAEAATTGQTAVGDAVENNARLLIERAREDGGGFDFS